MSPTVLPHVYEVGFRSGEFVRSIGGLLLGLSSSTSNESTTSSINEVCTSIMSFPLLYINWWWKLVQEEPIHVFVETTLILSIIYMLISRNKDWREERKDKLTPDEEEELLREWKSQSKKLPLGATISDTDEAFIKQRNKEDKAYPSVVVHEMKGRTMDITIDDETKLRTVVNFANFDFLGMSSTDDSLPIPYNPNQKYGHHDLGIEEEKKEREQEEQPKRKDEKKNTDKNAENTETPTSASSGVGSSVKDAARAALGHYGCGSCGPRGFYGTIDVHLDLEKDYSEFLQVDGAILYSDGASTCSSTVAAFAKRGDLIIADEGIYEPLVAGVKLSRAYVKWFKHNDMDDLRRVLENVRQTDKKLKRKSNKQRRFIIVEGLYRNTGKIVPLDQLVKLKHEYNCRLILDESHSFGTLGKTGKGVMELYSSRPMYDVEITTMALENAIGSIGGITVGSEEVVDHQRLSGSGYCFSASSPPFTASAAIQSLKQLQTYGPTILLKQLDQNKQYMHEQLTKLVQTKGDEDNHTNLFLVSSDERSTIIYFMLNGEIQQQALREHQKKAELLKHQKQQQKEQKKLKKKTTKNSKSKQEKKMEKSTDASENESTNTTTTSNTTKIAVSSAPLIDNEFILVCNIARKCLENGVAVVATGKNFGNVRAEPPPAIRLTLSAIQTKDDMDKAIRVLSTAVNTVVSEYVNSK